MAIKELAVLLVLVGKYWCIISRHLIIDNIVMRYASLAREVFPDVE